MFQTKSDEAKNPEIRGICGVFEAPNAEKPPGVSRERLASVRQRDAAATRFPPRNDRDEASGLYSRRTQSCQESASSSGYEVAVAAAGLADPVHAHAAIAVTVQGAGENRAAVGVRVRRVATKVFRTCESGVTRNCQTAVAIGFGVTRCARRVAGAVVAVVASSRCAVSGCSALEPGSAGSCRAGRHTRTVVARIVFTHGAVRAIRVGVALRRIRTAG